MADRSGPASATGSAVLVHGLWGNPDDWSLVRQLLEGAGVRVGVPDLPSHRFASSGLTDDAAEVREVVHSSMPPVVLVGWSYGGRVISLAAAGEPSVTHLVYVAAVPTARPDDLGWVEQDPHVFSRPDGTFVLDDDWWLNEEVGTTFPADVLEQLRQHPRRPVGRGIAQPQSAAAWQAIPTTVIVGEADELISSDERQWAMDNLTDLRVIDSDHFIPFRQPEAIGDIVVDALRASRGAA
jgi:pimeloyl-ACP methyl ester carboxylesterase